MTDHFIQRRKPARDLLAPFAERVETDENAYKGEVVLYYPSAIPDAAERELYSAMAQVRQGANLKGGIPRLEAAIEKYRPAEGEFYFELAEAYGKSGLTDKAIAMYEQALRRKPDFRPAVQRLEVTLGRSGRLSQAAEMLQKALATAPEDTAILGLVYAGLGKTREAVETPQKALRLDPDFPDAYNNLGGALQELGDRAGAEAAWREAVRVQPDLAEAQKNLANVLSGTGQLLAHDQRHEPSHEEEGERRALLPQADRSRDLHAVRPGPEAHGHHRLRFRPWPPRYQPASLLRRHAGRCAHHHAL